MSHKRTAGVFLLGVLVGAVLPFIFTVIEVLVQKNQLHAGHLLGPPYEQREQERSATE